MDNQGSCMDIPNTKSLGNEIIKNYDKKINVWPVHVFVEVSCSGF